MSDSLYKYYENAFLSIKRGNHAGVIINAKPIYYITIFDLISKNREIKDNKIYFTPALQEAYVSVSKKILPDSIPTPFYKPFYYSKSEPFYHLSFLKEAPRKGISNLFINDYVDYAYLDTALWALLQDPGIRARLRETIMNHFFATTEIENDNRPEEPATPRQLWALKRATGIDYRGRGLTKFEAWEMISESMKKAEEQGIDPSLAEATPNQLRYLKRATGIDYASKSLTKADASKMIRELKEEESDAIDETSSEEEATNKQLRYLKRVTGIDYSNRGLTKRQASKLIQECTEGGEGLPSTSEQGSTRPTHQAKQPDPEPGSLEDILSKCKTREEQLEAARKFFGEDK